MSHFDPETHDPFGNGLKEGGCQFKENYQWSFDSEHKHPTMNFNEMETIPDSCKAVRLCGNTDLLKYKEMGEEVYLKERVFDPSGLEKRLNRGGVAEKTLKEDDPSSSLIDLLEKSITPTELEANFKHSNGDSSVYKKTEPGIRKVTDFFKRTNGSPETPIQKEESLLYEMYPGEVSFLEGNKHYFSIETKNGTVEEEEEEEEEEKNHDERETWRPTLKKCSHLGEETCDTVLVNLDYLREKYLHTLLTLFGPKWTNKTILNIADRLVVFRVFIRWSFKKDHSRSHCKRVPEVPKEILTEESLIKMKEEKGLMRKNPKTFICTGEPPPSNALLAQKSKRRYERLGIVAHETKGARQCTKKDLITEINSLRSANLITRNKHDIFAREKTSNSPSREEEEEEENEKEKEGTSFQIQSHPFISQEQQDENMEDFQLSTTKPVTKPQQKRAAPRKKRSPTLPPKPQIERFFTTTTTTTTIVKREGQ